MGIWNDRLMNVDANEEGDARYRRGGELSYSPLAFVI